MAVEGGKRATQERSRETMESYMDAAEAMFIRFGYEGTSIRAISKAAKKNLSTVVYHWGTKEELFRAVIVRRFKKMEARKIGKLRELEQREAPIAPEDLEDILHAMVHPGFVEGDDKEDIYITGQLYGRVLTDPSPVVLRITEELFKDVTDLWRGLVRECFPQMSDEVFFWRFTGVVGALIFTQSFGYRVAHANRIEDQDISWETASDETIRFMAAGLRAAY